MLPDGIPGRINHIIASVNDGIIFGMGLNVKGDTLNDMQQIGLKSLKDLIENNIILNQYNKSDISINHLNFDLLPDEGMNTVDFDDKIIIYGGFSGVLCKIEKQTCQIVFKEYNYNMQQSMYGGLIY